MEDAFRQPFGVSAEESGGYEAHSGAFPRHAKVDTLSSNRPRLRGVRTFYRAGRRALVVGVMGRLAIDVIARDECKAAKLAGREKPIVDCPECLPNKADSDNIPSSGLPDVQAFLRG